MIIELIQARGIRAWLDGHQPLNRWEYDSDAQADIKVINASLQFPTTHGTQTVTKISLDKPLVDIVLDDPNTQPTIVTLQFADSNELTLKVSQVVVGDHRRDKPIKVKLVNGQTIAIDEISVYVKAE